MRWLIVLPFERPEHMGVDFAAELAAMGHAVRTFAYRRDNALYKNRSTKPVYQRLIARRLVHESSEWRPDVVLVVKGGPIEPASIHEIKQRTGARFVNIFPDNPLWMIEFGHIEAYDVFSTKEPYALRQLRLAGLRNVQYLPLYCVPAFHEPVEPTGDERRALQGRVALVGARYGYRERFVAEIADLPVRVWGPGWTRTADPRVRALVAGGFVSGRAKSVIYETATLSLNLHHPLNDIAGVNLRTFELAAAGACQLVDLKEDLASLFKPGEEVVAFRDLPDARRQIDDYLAHPDEARAIGANARRRAFAEHTVRHRIEEILATLDVRTGGRP